MINIQQSRCAVWGVLEWWPLWRERRFVRIIENFLLQTRARRNKIKYQEKQWGLSGMLSMAGYDFNHGIVTDALTVYYLWSGEIKLSLIKSKLSENIGGLHAFAWPGRRRGRVTGSAVWSYDTVSANMQWRRIIEPVTKMSHKFGFGKLRREKGLLLNSIVFTRGR